MGKMRKPEPAALPTDENDGGWLSTRNTKKVSPPLVKTRRGNHLLRRPVPRSPLITLMDDTPPTALKPTKKQTSIADFFSPHLQGLPPRVEADQAQIQHVKSIKEEQTWTYCGEDEMYVDFDMPGPTPASTGRYASQNSQYLDFDMPAPTPSQPNPTSFSEDDDSYRTVLASVTSQSAKATNSSSSDKAELCLPHNETAFCDRVDENIESCESKMAFQNLTRRSVSGKDRLTRHNGESVHISHSTKTGIDVCPMQDQSMKCSKHTRHIAGLVGETTEKNYQHKLLSEPKCKPSNTSDEDSFPDSLQTPHFLKETYHTLTTQYTAGADLAGAAKEENCLHKLSSEAKCQTSSNTSNDTFLDSLQTPPFLKETYHTLDFSQLPEEAKASTFSETGHVMNGSCPMQDQSTKHCKHTRYTADTDLVGEAKEENCLHKLSSEAKCQTSSNTSDEDTCLDSLQTPQFLKETYHTLNFSQLPEVVKAPSTSQTGHLKNRSISTRAEHHLQTVDSHKTPKKDTLFGDSTEVNSLRFTDDSSSLDSQLWSSSQLSSHKAIDRKMPEQNLTTVSSSYGEQIMDSMQTPDFLSSERELCDSQDTDSWGGESLPSGRFRVGNVSTVSDDLQTPSFLRGFGEDSNSVDMC